RHAERLAHHQHPARTRGHRTDGDARDLVALALRGGRVRASGDAAHVAARQRIGHDADGGLVRGRARGQGSSLVTPVGYSVKKRLSPKQSSLESGSARTISRLSKSITPGANTMSAPGGPGRSASGL